MANENLLSMDEVLASNDVKYETIVVPEWSGSIRIGSLSAEDIIEWTEANEGPAKRTAGIRLIIKSLVDGQGNRIGSDKHIAGLKAKNADVLNRVVRQILTLNGLNVKEQEERKNGSGEANIAASPTGSLPS